VQVRGLCAEHLNEGLGVEVEQVTEELVR
jgi:hypothetical protein